MLLGPQTASRFQVMKSRTARLPEVPVSRVSSAHSKTQSLVSNAAPHAWDLLPTKPSPQVTAPDSAVTRP